MTSSTSPYAPVWDTTAQGHKTEIGTTKRSKVRTVDFCDTLWGGAKPTHVQELLGHSDVNLRLRYREAKRTSARLLDKVVGGA